jgi:hypothetical protein
MLRDKKLEDQRRLYGSAASAVGPTEACSPLILNLRTIRRSRFLKAGESSARVALVVADSGAVEHDAQLISFLSTATFLRRRKA